ncbi:MAG: TetR/AcrR family transcriptional regulator, partial [Bacteroidota bacterium]|nr:TetR/AcrR family transcriptional regulator [Bacteroidota bacterium]
KVCLVGSLSPDYHTLSITMQNDLSEMAQAIVDWLALLLESGKEKNIFFYSLPSRTKALLIITNMIAALQITRLLGEKGFDEIRKGILQELTEPYQK